MAGAKVIQLYAWAFTPWSVVVINAYGEGTRLGQREALQAWMCTLKYLRQLVYEWETEKEIQNAFADMLQFDVTMDRQTCLPLGARLIDIDKRDDLYLILPDRDDVRVKEHKVNALVSQLLASIHG